MIDKLEFSTLTKFHVVRLFRLKAPAVFAGGLAKVLGAVAAEVREGGKIHVFGYLGERQALVIQIVFDYGHGVTVDVRADAVASDPFDGGGEIFGRYVQPLGVIAHIAFCTADSGSEQRHELFHNIGRAVAVGIGSVALGMRLEDVIHHRQAEASHQFVVEEQMAVAHAVTKTVEVGKQMSGLFIGEFDDGILVQRDAAADAVIIGWQQVLKELIVGGEPLHLHISVSREVADTGGIWNDGQVVLDDVVASVIEYKASFTSRAEQMHTGVAQLRRIHPVEVRGILEINLHRAKIRRFLQIVKILVFFVKTIYR